MIIVNKPFMYLRVMMLERRADMTCKDFLTKEKISSKDAEYIVITLEDFLHHSKHIGDYLLCEYNLKSYWVFDFVKLGLKIIRDAEIGIATKQTFPLIIRNKDYNFYIAGRTDKIDENKK